MLILIIYSNAVYSEKKIYEYLSVTIVFTTAALYFVGKCFLAIT